mmetsp:Transcript_8954/g.16134  ORF Transcript_8954/g.16134 Transcript_8954/m.16134 type:complete len:424 (-) Transcript_8954:77-1348(-)
MLQRIATEDGRALHDMWDTLRISDVIECIPQTKHHVLCLPASTPLGSACEQILSHPVLSALVLKDTQYQHTPNNSDDNSPFLGVFSYRTLLFLTLDMFGKLPPHPQLTRASFTSQFNSDQGSPSDYHYYSSPDSKSSDSRNLDFKSIVKKSAYSDLPDLGSLLVSPYSAEVNSPVLLSENDYVSAAMFQFTYGVHRLSVMKAGPRGKTNEILATLSQRDLLEYIWTQLLHSGSSRGQDESSESEPSRQLMESIANKSLLQLGIQYKPVAALSSSKQVIDALEIMYENHFSAIAIVNPAALNLIGVLCLADIKFLYRKKRMNIFREKLGKVLKEIREEVIELRRIERKQRLYTDTHRRVLDGLEDLERDDFPYTPISLRNSLAEAVGRLVTTSSDHLWVVDAHQVPIGIVSGTDVLRALAPVLR